MTAEEVCDYVKASGPLNDGGCVHLAARVYLAKGRISRQAGEFLCSPARGRKIRHPRAASRREFEIECCTECLAAAAKLGIDPGPWPPADGPRVCLYTTSPPRRDRPYALRGAGPVGTHGRGNVWRVSVPGELAALSRKWYQLDAYRCWDEAGWAALRGTSHSDEAGQSG